MALAASVAIVFWRASLRPKPCMRFHSASSAAFSSGDVSMGLFYTDFGGRWSRVASPPAHVLLDCRIALCCSDAIRATVGQRMSHLKRLVSLLGMRLWYS